MKCAFTCLFWAVLVTARVFSLSEETVNKTDETVKITLFYETLCPASIEFIAEQLYPTTQKLSKYIKLDLVPYGDAKRKLINMRWRFSCQHGEAECYGNKIHACVLEQSKFKSQESLMDVLTCLMRTSYSDADISKCLGYASYNYTEMKTCMITSAGDLLAEYGQRTNDNPRVTFVPMVMFNDYSNETLQDEATNNLFKITCSLFKNAVPYVCKTCTMQ